MDDPNVYFSYLLSYLTVYCECLVSVNIVLDHQFYDYRKAR